MIDEIDYFPKRDKYKKKQPADDGWNELKKLKSEQDGKKKKSGKQNPQEAEQSPGGREDK